MRAALFILILSVAACATRQTPPAETRADVVAYVNRAARLVASEGANACAALQQPAWFSSEWYIFVLDADGTTVCHPARPELVGNTLSALVDANGKRFGSDFITAAQHGGGWVDYVWPRPGETEPTPKSTYVRPVTASDGKVYLVGSGGHSVR